MFFANTNIVVGVTGGIAVYKAVDFVSKLKKQGASVHVIMTESATKFVTPLTFREISQNPVVVSMWDEPKNFNVQHIALAALADIFVVAPATANIIGKTAAGIADDMLSTTIMATKAPVVFCPAMNTNMYLNPIVQDNIEKLKKYGYIFMEPASGMLACGTSGSGRLPEPENIVEFIKNIYNPNKVLMGKKVIVTAAGTREPIDPVRFIGNRSSGKMGYAMAKAAAKRGAEVVLVSGPSSLAAPENVKLISVETTQEMREAVLREYGTADIVIKSAAVADYRPHKVAEQKIKKTDENLTIVLEKNPDILAELGQLKKHQFLVGFAAETRELISYAQDKIRRKNLDMIVANDVTLTGAGFNSDTNIVKLLYKDGAMEELPIMTKEQLADIIFDKICAKLDIKA